MHKHPRQSKRKILAIRFFIYGIMTLATVVISAICILLVLGYQFNFSKRTVEQGGLLQLRSFPAGATIGVDGGRLSFVTPGKQNVTAGTHTVTMSRQGYRPWAKTVAVDPGQLLWLNYARLVPQSITTEPVRDFASLVDVLPSPDKRFIAMLTSKTVPEVTIADISQPDNVRFTTIEIPAAKFTASKDKSHSFSLKEWDFGSRYLLLEHNFDKSREYIRIDSQDESRTANVTKELGLAISDMHFSGGSGNIYYTLSNNTLRKADLGAKTISAPLVQDVTSFMLYGSDSLAYVGQADGQRTVGMYHDNKDYLIAQYSDDLPVTAAVTKYFNRYYMAVSHGKQMTLYGDPQTDNKKQIVEVELKQAAKWLNFSGNGRFAVAGDGDNYTSLDLETDLSYTGTLAGARSTNRPFQWLDDYYFVTSGSQDMRIVEFDGSNQQFITNAAPGFMPALSENGEALFSVVRQSDGRFTLQRSNMVIE